MPGGKAKRKKIIKEDIKPKKNVKEDIEPKKYSSSGMIINFSCPLAFYSCRVGKEYTNYLKSPSDFVEIRRKIFDEALVHFSKTTLDNLAQDKGAHTHIIKDEKRKLVEKILTELSKIKWPDSSTEGIVSNYMSGDIWQLGYSNGLRLIGFRQDNIFNLLFIDYHHLIEPSKDYNQIDYFKFNYCPMTSEYCSNCKGKQ